MKDAVVFYHGLCPDGFGAAFAAWLVLKDTADYIACTHGDTPCDVTGKRVFILDFAFEEEKMRRLDEQARELILLDHHKTTQEKLHGFKCRCGGLTFDLQRSGAMMAWQYFHPNEPVPALIAHIQDRDLWRWKLPESANFLAALDAEKFDFQAWERVLRFTPQEHAQYVTRGQAMNDKFQALCDEIVQEAKPVRLAGHDGLVVNAPSMFSSELGNRMANRSGTFGMILKVESADTLKVSLRSNAPFEVEPLARLYGGGGHPQASAFRIPLTQLGALLRGEL